MIYTSSLLNPFTFILQEKGKCISITQITFFKFILAMPSDIGQKLLFPRILLINTCHAMNGNKLKLSYCRPILNHAYNCNLFSL